MATKQPDKLKLSKKSQESIVSFLRKIVEAHKNNTRDLVDKMDSIDLAYYRYKESEATGSSDGVDANKACDVFDTKDHVVPPLVISQVDSFTAYLADVFLSGYPIFPVVSTPANRKNAEALETLLDDHAQIGGYARQLLMFLRNACKYNYAAVEVDWDMINQFSTLQDYTTTERRLQAGNKYFNRVRNLDPRNVIRDPSVLPGDVAELGDYAGYVERVTATQLKRLVIKLQKEARALNVDEAMTSAIYNGLLRPSVGTDLFQEKPVVNNYTSSPDRAYGVDWDAYLDGTNRSRRPSYGAMYEKITIYARIMPADHQIAAPQPNTPQIWKFILINDKLLTAYRIVSAYDYLPILFGQPIEDGFAEQTQSIGESQIPFQEAATTLYGIRFAAARRAVSDRALYNSNVLSKKDVNSKAAAPKIPVNINPLMNQSLDNIYRQIPFDMRGTETALADAQLITNFGQQLSGLNNAQQGQFQRGNKSVVEWTDVMGGSENRLRLPALTLEHQVFMPMKSIMTLNIFQFGEDAELVSQKTGHVVKINIAELRNTVLSFRVADGYTPKAKMASTEMIAQGMTMIGNSPVLQQAYGAMLPSMFAHLMSLGGVRGLEEYSPEAPVAPSPANLDAALLQGTGQAGIGGTGIASGMPAMQMDPAQLVDPMQGSLP